MDCYLCLTEKLTIDSSGICVECLQGVCTEPSTRRDHAFHGEKCTCGCRKLVCQVDMEYHSKGQHQGSVPTCFPKISMQEAANALGAAMAIRPSQTNETHPKPGSILNRFINFIRPGSIELWNARSIIPESSWQRFVLFGRDNRPLVVLNDEFLQKTSKRIASLAFHTLGQLILENRDVTRSDLNKVEGITEPFRYQFESLPRIPRDLDDTEITQWMLRQD